MGVALSEIAYGHHGFAGRYDLAAPVWIEGLVVEAFFGNPHPELTVRVPQDVGLPSSRPELGPAGTYLDAQALWIPQGIAGQTVILELPPTPQYFRLSDRISEGDTISAVAVRNCEPPHQLNVQWLRLSNGEVESRTGALSYMVERC
jgi:hypothetical protein